MDTFLKHYIIAALWSSVGDDGEPLDKAHDITDLAPEAVERMRADCTAFVALNRIDLIKAGNDEQNGHDFWLTRNHHGAGFWDRGYDGGVGDRLTISCECFGEQDLYKGDDGKLYVAGGHVNGRKRD